MKCGIHKYKGQTVIRGDTIGCTCSRQKTDRITELEKRIEKLENQLKKLKF